MKRFYVRYRDGIGRLNFTYLSADNLETARFQASLRYSDLLSVKELT